MRYGPLEVSGNLETQNLLRHATPNEFNFVQNRNTFRLRVDYDWLQNGKLIDRFEMPFLERSKLYLLYRGVYDGVYDIQPGERQHGQTRWDDWVGGSLTDLTGRERSGFKFENRLREAYIDGKLKDLPLTFRIGRQQVIWGESDQFRIMDIWNPLDITWHFQQETWDNIRIPLWMAKFLWDFGDVWKFNNVFAEVVYNPFDFQPGIKPGFLPQPWALPFPNPLRDGQIQRTEVSPLALIPTFDLNGTSLRRGDFQRNPRDASEVGTRLHFVTPFGLETSLAYMYARGRGVGASSPFAVRLNRLDIGSSKDVVGRYQIDKNRPVAADALTRACSGLTAEDNAICVAPVWVDAEVIHPYMHIFGLTGNYYDDISETVFRFETAYVMGEPYQTIEEDKLPPMYIRGQQVGTGPFGLAKRDVWTGMIGFDRPTWIRWLNPRATWFLSGQLFWQYTPGRNVDKLRGNSGAGDDPYFGPIGQWISGPRTGQYERQQNADLKGNGDNIRQWESMITLAATSFYRGGTVVPFLASVWDPVDSNLELIWNLDYFLTNNFIVTLQQKYFMTYGSDLPSNDPWYVGGRFARRDETGVKLTYQY